MDSGCWKEGAYSGLVSIFLPARRALLPYLPPSNGTGYKMPDWPAWLFPFSLTHSNNI